MAKRTIRLLAFVGLSISFAGCGGGSSNPSSPTKTVRSIAITPATSTVPIGGSETYGMTATYSDGSTAVVTGTWTSDALSVLTIDNSGKAQGISSGLATITALHQGVSKTLLIQVTPDYQGTWDGDYSVTHCQETGDWRDAELCHGADSFAVGDLLPIKLTITQSGRQLTGQMGLGDIQGTLSLTIEDGGSATGTGSLTFTAEGFTVTTAVNSLRLRPEGERMTGSFTPPSRRRPAPVAAGSSPVT